jgi:hypothetical protein
MAKNGPIIEKEIETKKTKTWRFTADELRKRLHLPSDARLFLEHNPEADPNTGDVELFDDVPLVATVVETKKEVK